MFVGGLNRVHAFVKKFCKQRKLGEVTKRVGSGNRPVSKLTVYSSIGWESKCLDLRPGFTTYWLSNLNQLVYFFEPLFIYN